MANEATLITEVSLPINMTVADGAGIEKGAILSLADPRTVSGSAADKTGEVFGGIAYAEKIASDGVTSLAVYRPGSGNVFDMTVNAGTGVTLGEYVATSGANFIRTATEAEIAAGKAVGKVLETGNASEVVNVEI